MFTAVLFTIAKSSKQTECPLTEEWIKKMWYVYTMEYYSVIKGKNESSVGKFGGEKRLSSLVYVEDQSNFKTRSLHHLRRPQAPSRIAKGASP